jgi:hypothetical protein
VVPALPSTCRVVGRLQQPIGVIPFDGQRSCADADRRDRNATNGITPASKRRRSPWP